jgi:uncharacterized protein (UPF0335 family)
MSIGHNSIAGEQLTSLIERIERLDEEKAQLSADISDIFKEAKSQGFDPKIMREVLKLRKMDKSDREERDALLDLYMNALGLI